MKRRYLVTVELPRQTIEVYARNAGQAKFLAYQMIGAAGVEVFGTLAVLDAKVVEATATV